MNRVEPVGTVRPTPGPVWSGPQPLAQAGIAPDAPGVYQLLAMGDGKPLEIPRCLKADPEGRLYWGAAPNGLRGRVADLVASFCGQSPADRKRHGAGERYHRNRSYNAVIPMATLYVRFWEIELGDDFKFMIGAMLDAQNSGEILTDVQEVYRILGEDLNVPDPRVDDWTNQAAVYLYERSGLWHYEQEFGELPPLNRIGGVHVN